MAFEFKTQKTNSSRITYSAQHDPLHIIAAVASTPLSEHKAQPPVTTHTLGNGKIAVRHYPINAIELAPNRNPDLIHPKDVFNVLKKSVLLKTAFVEMPVALIQTGKSYKLVTRWKLPNAPEVKPLEDYLSAHNIPLQDKINAALSAAKQLAKIHAAGIIHGHPHTRNVLVNPRASSTHFIDPTKLQLSKPNSERTYADFQELSVDITSNLSSAGHYKEVEEVARQLEQTYNETKNKYANRIKQIKQKNGK